jgi:hypothetical protein
MLGQSRLRRRVARTAVRAAIVLILSHGTSLALAQHAPVSPDHPWYGPGEARIEADARNLTESRLNFDPARTYSLAELIDLSESQNPETRDQEFAGVLLIMASTQKSVTPSENGISSFSTRRRHALIAFPQKDGKQTLERSQFVRALHLEKFRSMFFSCPSASRRLKRT